MGLLQLEINSPGSIDSRLLIQHYLRFLAFEASWVYEGQEIDQDQTIESARKMIKLDPVGAAEVLRDPLDLERDGSGSFRPSINYYIAPKVMRSKEDYEKFKIWYRGLLE